MSDRWDFRVNEIKMLLLSFWTVRNIQDGSEIVHYQHLHEAKHSSNNWSEQHEKNLKVETKLAGSANSLYVLILYLKMKIYIRAYFSEFTTVVSATVSVIAPSLMNKCIAISCLI